MKPENLTPNLASSVLLDRIDKLFASGVGDYVSLPQLVVVGDQSSGKSSVLEGLTKLPFPRDSGLCTRFATQITFRRARESNISVSIIPDKNSTEEHVAALKAWTRSDLKALDADTFSAIMTEVHALMGLGDRDSKGLRGSFSEDVLRLEICGPDEEHYSVVDVPGIFRKTTEGMTTKADQAMVTSMVRRYMNNPRSIMLTVIPANVDIATQEILTMAEEADQEGHRTLGVLTKPDLVDGGAEAMVLDLVEGKRHQLNLGWCIVRNLGQQQLLSASVDRNVIEMAFFCDRAPWNKLDKDRVGIDALRYRLQEILTNKIRGEFPKVKSEINRKLTVARNALEQLGGKRETSPEQRRYLLDMSIKFQEVTASALSVNYVGSDWIDQHSSLRFVTNVVNRSEAFEIVLARHGHSYSFESSQSSQSQMKCGTDDAELEELSIRYSSTSIQEPIPEPPRSPSPRSEQSRDGIDVRNLDESTGLEELTINIEQLPKVSNTNILGWLTQAYKSSRGFELGTFDSSLLAMTMKTQSSKWDAIALGYVSDIINMAHGFISQLLDLVCPDQRVRDELMSTLTEGLFARYGKAISHARFLLYVERNGTPSTLNHYFNDNLEKCRQKRSRDALEGKSFTSNKHGQAVLLDDIVQNHPMSNVEHIVLEIHDILKSYYKVARKRFTDDICKQAADYFLVTGPESPLKLFSPSFVNDLSENQLEVIAGEDASLKRRRAALEKEIRNLDAGRRVLI